MGYCPLVVNLNNKVQTIYICILIIAKIHFSLWIMRGIYETVSLRTTLEDVSFIFQIYNGYIGLNTCHKLLMRYIHMMDVIWEF